MLCSISEVRTRKNMNFKVSSGNMLKTRDVTAKTLSSKSYIIAISLCMVFGTLGLHHFYTGRYGEGVLDVSLFILSVYFFMNGQILWAILFFAIDALHTFIVTIILICGNGKDGKGHYICYLVQNRC